MKYLKKACALILALAITVAFTPSMAFAAGTAGGPVTIGDVSYDTLADAVAAVPADGNQVTITLQQDLTGGGVKVNSGQNVLFDLNGKTYTVDKTVGSSGTETNAFQLLKGSTVEFKNGSLKSNTAKILIQNYCDLTLQDVNVDTSDNPNCMYCVSNNFGSFTAKGNTNLIAAPGQAAFDVYYGLSSSYYDGVSVSFGKDFTGKVTGNIEYGIQSGAPTEGWQDKAVINIDSPNGTFDVNFKEGTTDAFKGGPSIKVSSGDLTDAAKTSLAAVTEARKAADKSITDYELQNYIAEKDVVAVIGTDTYMSLADAVAAASSGDTIKMVSDSEISSTVVVGKDKNIILDMNGKTLSNTTGVYVEKYDGIAAHWSLIGIQGKITITGNGVFNAAKDGFALDTQDLGASCTIENGTFKGNEVVTYAYLGNFIIKGGTFSLNTTSDTNPNDPYGFLLNCYDRAYNDKYASIKVSGGTFEHFDPSNCVAEGAGTNFVADGFYAISNDNVNYTVVNAEAKKAVDAAKAAQADAEEQVTAAQQETADALKAKADAEKAAQEAAEQKEQALSDLAAAKDALALAQANEKAAVNDRDKVQAQLETAQVQLDNAALQVENAQLKEQIALDAKARAEADLADAQTALTAAQDAQKKAEDAQAAAEAAQKTAEAAALAAQQQSKADKDALAALQALYDGQSKELDTAKAEAAANLKAAQDAQTALNDNKAALDAANKENDSLKAALAAATADADALVKAQQQVKDLQAELTALQEKAAQCAAARKAVEDELAALKEAVKMPGKVTGLKVAAGTGRATLTYNAVPGAAKYQIYRSLSKDTGYKLQTMTTSLKYVNGGLVKGKRYYYKVRAVKVINSYTYVYGINCVPVLSAAIR